MYIHEENKYILFNYCIHKLKKINIKDKMKDQLYILHTKSIMKFKVC